MGEVGEVRHWDDDRPLPRPSWQKWALLTVVLVLITPFVVYGLLRSVIHGPVNSRSLNTSVAVAYGSSFVSGAGSCRKLRSGDWRCSVGDQAGSGAKVYDVRVRPGSSCWDARFRFDQGEGSNTKRLSSCVHVINERFIDSLLN